jgi:hypothetical protein
MDTDMLSLALNESRTYQETVKDVFVSKLDEVFQIFKSNGNTALIPYAGKCGSEECTNRGCRGYSFFGNVSNDFLSLIFEEEEGSITDIHNCYFMIPENADWEFSNQITLNIYTEDKASFFPTFDYSTTQQKCEEAINDLQKAFNNRITNEDASSWLTYYNPLKDKSSHYILHGGFIKAFRSIYFDIERIHNLISKEKEAVNAINDFRLISPTDNEALLSWLVKYEEFGQDLDYFVADLIIDFKEAVANGFIPLKGNHEIHFLVDRSSKIPVFLDTFSERYWNYVKSISNAGTYEGTQDYYTLDRLFLTEYVERRNNQNNLE